MLKTNALIEMREQREASQRRGQRRNEQRVIAAGRGAGERAGGVAAQAVRDQPLPIDELALAQL
jgi:hypothetical protein